ncbi:MULTISPECIES: hypothetical protein [Pseudofrankia]|uniref:hypothetical protein n=1 Tax=Pseudofrankia TaxID=2994363 RepID=UPI000234B687|nr:MULTISPECIES: hypothetical protein [Pseudofrankia]OHV40554.1 hypothetical protein BCD49_08255 [Pseudofrankia sp. EUN1h]
MAGSPTQAVKRAANAALDSPAVRASPDGTVLRFYHFTDPTDGLARVEFRDGQHIGTHYSPPPER